MADLLAIGPNPKDWFRWTIPEQTTVRIGRGPRTGWRVPWDAAISREHADLTLVGERLRVRQLGTAKNPVVFKDHSCPEFEMLAGEQFWIGETAFRFQVVQFQSDSNSPVSESSFTPHAIRTAPFTDPEQKLESLLRDSTSRWR